MRKLKYDAVIPDKESLITVLDSMPVILGLCQTEKQALDIASNYIQENDNVEFAKRILNMIESNNASTTDIKEFCTNYIKSKEEENGI